MSFSCSICQELVTRDPQGPPVGGTGRARVEIVAASCGHVFHKSCIETWFIGRPRDCVICKAKVSPVMLKLFPNGSEEGEDIEKLTKRNRELFIKVSSLESSKQKAEKDLTKTERDLAKVKEEDQFKMSLLAIAQMELEAITQAKTDLQQELQQQFAIFESMKTALEDEKKQLEETVLTSELKDTDQQASIIKLTQEIRELKAAKIKMEAQLTVLTQQQRVRDAIDSSSRTRKPLLERRVGSEDIVPSEDGNSSGIGRTRLARRAPAGTTDLTDLDASPTGESEQVEVEAATNGNFTLVHNRVRGNSMGCQTLPLGVDFALDILDGTVDPLGMCIRILQDEKKFREAAADNAPQNGVQHSRKKGLQQAASRPLPVDEYED